MYFLLRGRQRLLLQTLYLDGNEVCLAFVGYSLGQKSLSAARGTIKQDPLGRGHPKLQELLWMFHRVLGEIKRILKLHVPCFSGCLQLGNELQKQSRDQTQAIKPADWSVWSRDRFCKLQAT